MSNGKTVLFMLCDTALHAGSGSELGIVDLPIQREKHTGYPKIESSSIKGCIREFFESSEKKPSVADRLGISNFDLISLVFGPEDDGQKHAGSVSFCDARLLLFPVKSVKGVFAWITCPAVIQRFISDMSILGIEISIDVSKIHAYSVPCESKILIDDENIVILEEFTFKNIEKSEECSKLAKWLADYVLPTNHECNYLKDWMKEKLIILSNDDFKDFVTMSTEVITRIKINPDTGTVEKGALFTEEYLPSDTILYSLIMSSGLFINEEKAKVKEALEKMNIDEKDMVIDYIKEMMPNIIQLGGNMNLGKGLIRTNFYSEGGKSDVNSK
mgnify:FL=1